MHRENMASLARKLLSTNDFGIRYHRPDDQYRDHACLNQQERQGGDMPISPTTSRMPTPYACIEGKVAAVQK